MTAIVSSQTRPTEGSDKAIYVPEDALTNFWMYAVLLAGTSFIVFVVVAIINMGRHSRTKSCGTNDTVSGTYSTNLYGRRSTTFSTSGANLLSAPSSSASEIRRPLGSLVA